MANIFTPTIINLSGPWNIAREDCIGDSLGFINANTNYLAYSIEALSATSFTRINSLSSELVNSNVGAVVIFQDQKPSGTGAGSPASINTWLTRTLNTKTADTNNLCAAPVSNTFTLPAGTWHIQGSAPAYAVLRHKIRLRNVTDSTTAALGTSEYTHVNTTYGVYVYNRSFIDAVITINTSKTFRIEHQVDRVQTGGFGVEASTGDVEVYTTVTCTKIR
jgi:hypothetical protein